MPTVSVVIPTYNHRDHVLAAVGSVFAQTFADLELIVVNDGSPDDTAAVLRPLAAAGRIRYVEQPNAGQGAARNRGLAEAGGEFVALLDDDDAWPPDRLAALVEALRADPAAVLAYGYAELVDATTPGGAADMTATADTAGGAETAGGAAAAPRPRTPDTAGPSGWVRRAFVDRGWIRSPGQTLIRADALRRVGGFDPALWGTDDWDLYLRLAAVGPFAYVDRCTLRYRLHAGNASLNVGRMYRNAVRVRRKHFGAFPGRRHREEWRACTAFIRGFCGGDAVAAARDAADQGRIGRALRMWLLATRIDPRPAAAAVGLAGLLARLAVAWRVPGAARVGAAALRRNRRRVARDAGTADAEDGKTVESGSAPPGPATDG